MDRETRKINLKKLQLPNTSEKKTKRKIFQSAKPITINTAITNYLTPEKHLEGVLDGVKRSSVAFQHNRNKHEPQSPTSPAKTSRARPKRVKLDAFIFKDPNNVPDDIKSARKFLNDDDLIVSEKNVKKAPKLTKTAKQARTSKSSRSKKQTTIKSAFLRNEQLFAEITAQHCAADQFDGDDVQLALALSKSEADSKGANILTEKLVNDEINLVDGNNQAESIREKLKKYGFRTAEKKDYNAFAAAFLPRINCRRPKSKWANKFTALTLRSSENQLQKLQENIQKLLNNQFRTESLGNHTNVLSHYKLQSSFLKKWRAHANKRVLQTADNINQSNEAYFVKELFEINELPAGHLLKDWSKIQGRDLTPKLKNKMYIRKIKKMECIYKELEEYFATCKILDSTSTSGGNDELEVLTKHISANDPETQTEKLNSVVKLKFNSDQITTKPEIVVVVDNQKESDETNIESTAINLSGSECDHEIMQLLPNPKSLDTMQVSGCSFNTQATINTTQKNKSNSPDLFADSDVDMEENVKANGDEPPEVETFVDKTFINAVADKGVTRTLEDSEAHITTYEIFSSDEVKNTSFSKHKISAVKEQTPINSTHAGTEQIIDLTEDNFQILNNNKSNNDDFTKSQTIEEIDLFAEYPLEEDRNSFDIKSFSIEPKVLQERKEDTFNKFTLSLEGNYTEEQSIKEKTHYSLKLSPVLQSQMQLEEEDNDIALHKLALDQSNISFLNFQDTKQLRTSFHKKTATTQKNNPNDDLTDNEAIFQYLCNKYLNAETSKSNTVKKAQNYSFRKSYSQILPTVQTPKKCDTTNFDMDLKRPLDNVTLKRKSRSFKDETPLKMAAMNTISFRSQDFNSNKSKTSTNLTANYAESNDDNDVEITEEEDDHLILSDDEINYSIWQADNIVNSRTSVQSDPEDDVISVPDTETASEEENIFCSKKNNFELPDRLKDKEKSLIKISLAEHEFLSDFQTSLKYSISNSLTQYENKIDRRDFGILEDYSEPIDSIPELFTPTKVLTDASFLKSPSETTAPMKRYSNCQRSSQKFQDLISNLSPTSPPNVMDNLNDFDEFDRITFMSPLKSVKSHDKPQDFDQLLTGEISFKELETTPETKNDFSSKSLSTTPQVVEYNNKIYTVRYTLSPKPDYSKYSEAELLKELYNFGIKPLKRKQAIKMLQYIYNQTHPILVEEDTDAKTQDDILPLDDFELPCTSREALKTNVANDRNFNEKELGINLSEGANKKFALKDCCGQEMLRYSIDFKAELSDEKYILQTNVTKKTPQPLLPFHIAWYNLVCSNEKLHETILLYEPIDLQEIYSFLKTLGYRYDPKDLKTFFDHRCIIFRYDLTGVTGGNGKIKGNNRHIRRNKKSKNNKN